MNKHIILHVASPFPFLNNFLFGYWNDIKMEHARIKEMNINEVGVGYKNPQHFSTAFKQNMDIHLAN